jgi:glycosyltransferase involved in cell wall biosynthesis
MTLGDKIIVTVRTLNEQLNIERFCQSYTWVDEIIVADGGSTDDTLSIVRKFDNTKLYHFTEKIYSKDVWSNPRGKHINFLFERAKFHEADWIIFDDCDCVPTVDLQECARKILSKSDKEMVFAYRMYIYGQDHYAPELNIPGQSLWAWRSNVNVRAKEDNPLWFDMAIPDASVHKLFAPFSLLHYCWQSEEEIKRKNEFYLNTGELPYPMNPLAQYEFVPLPEWAKWK